MIGSGSPTRRVRWLNGAMFAAIAASSLTLLFFVYQTIAAERAQRAQVQKTVDVLNDLRLVGTAVINGETGQRGYILTLDRRYLAPYEAGRALFPPALSRLRVSLGGVATPRQQQLIDEIDTLSRAKFAEMANSVKMVGEGRLIDARRAMLTDEGQETMERLRRAIREMEVIEAEALSRAADTAAATEARVLPMLGGLLFLLLLAVFGGSRLLAHTARAEAEAAQAAALAEARDRADLLARELNHRVKNLFAVVLAIVQMTARNKPEAKEVADTIAQRIHALLTAHEVTQGELDRPVAPLGTLIETTLAPYRSATQTAEVEGPEVLLPAKQVTPLGLVLHELTTNAVKYGAWKHSGTVHVNWRLTGSMVELIWCEDGLALSEEPANKGFGSLLMSSAARQLGGTIERKFGPGQLIVTVRFALAERQT